MSESASVRPASPSEAWRRLREGNFRFINGQTEHPNQDGAHRSSLIETEEPFAAIFGCSDSRLAAEIIFDVGLGDVFVVRTAGHVIDTASLGSLEYAVELLNIPLIVILGHDNCGAITSTMQAMQSGHMPRGFIRDLVEHITPSVYTAQSHDVYDVNSTVMEHVEQTTARLLDRSRIIAEAITEGRTAVVGITYRLAEGKAQLISGFGVS